MVGLYSQQAVLRRFTGQARQKGSGFGSLATSVRRVALPFGKKGSLPVVKSTGKELFAQNLPDRFEVASKKINQTKSAVRKNVKQKMGGSAKENFVTKKSKISFEERKKLTNVLPAEASDSKLKIMERQPLPITFDTSFEQENGTLDAPNGPTLEFNTTGDQTKFTDAQNNRLEVK